MTCSSSGHAWCASMFGGRRCSAWWAAKSSISMVELRSCVVPLPAAEVVKSYGAAMATSLEAAQQGASGALDVDLHFTSWRSSAW
jgi:hypothetical protein